jgi:hypothetical protein
MALSPEPPETKFQEMTRQIRALQERVERLERRSGVEVTPEPILPLVVGNPLFAADTGKITALIGKALLALAFAYLLRALTEMKYLPLHAGVALGIVYALAWLLFASRADSSEKLTAGIRAISSTLILIPLLWEAQIRFQALSTWTTAFVLVLFSIFGLGISWRKNLSAVAWVATLAGTFTVWVLLVATRDLAPFTCALLALAAAVEVSACLEHWLRERWIIAALTDLAVVLVTYLVTQKQGLPEGYAAVGRPAVLAFQIALLVIYLSSTVVRTVGRGFVITGFEIGQCVLAFVIAGWGALRVTQGHATAVIIVGCFCIVCCAACYTVAFLFHTRVQDTERNFYTYATFGLVLAIAASSLLLHGIALVLLWSALAVIFAAAGRRAGRMTLKWHGVVYLMSAAAVSGAGPALASRFLRSVSHDDAGGPTWVVTAAAVLAYLVVHRRAGDADWSYRLVALVLSAAAALTIAVSAAGVAVRLCPGSIGPPASPHFCATMFTAILTVLAIALAWAARKRRIWELIWVPYILIALATVKLFVQDLRGGHVLGIVISLLFYGSALVLLPRFTAGTKGLRDHAFSHRVQN